MLSYELAEQLKDAGFPQSDAGGEGRHLLPGDNQAQGIEIFSEDAVYVPTLSELIEACSQEFAALYNQISEWQATSNSGISGYGETPEEAVAKLYLALEK